jgi:hypothetical protein
MYIVFVPFDWTSTLSPVCFWFVHNSMNFADWLSENIVIWWIFLFPSKNSKYYSLRFYFPSLSLLAQPVNIFVYTCKSVRRHVFVIVYPRQKTSSDKIRKKTSYWSGPVHILKYWPCNIRKYWPASCSVSFDDLSTISFPLISTWVCIKWILMPIPSLCRFFHFFYKIS